MRKIKFKFLMENGEITQPYHLKELIDSDAYVNIECKYSSKIKQELQYSELKIKDVEVYEKDLIQARKNFIYEVKFENGAFYLYHYNKYAGLEKVRWGLLNRLFDSDMQDILKECKVIGNIYKNQEFLK